MTAKKRVLVACSAKGGVPYWWFEAYDKTLRLDHPKFEFEFAMEAGNSAINISRNIIADKAIAQGYWKLVQIDTDAFWTPEQLVHIVDHDEPIVAGPYIRKQSGTCSWLVVRTPGATVRADGLLECDFIGTHFFATSIEALKHMVWFFPERAFEYDEKDGEHLNKVMTELFPIGLVGPNTPEGRISRIREVLKSNEDPKAVVPMIRGILENSHPQKARLLGEDYHFCQLAKKSGLKLYCDTTSVLGHVGDIVYPVGPDKLSVASDFPTHTLKMDMW